MWFSVAFSPDGQLLASGVGRNTIKIWDPTSGSLIHTLEDPHSIHHPSPPGRSIAFSPNSQRLLSASANAVEVWDPTSGDLICTLEGHRTSVLSVAFSPNNQQLASGSMDHTIKIWDPAVSTHIQALEGHSKEVTCMDLSATGRLLASVSRDHTIKIWDLTDLTSVTCIQTLEGHRDYFVWAYFSPDESTLASCNAGHVSTVEIWDPASGNCLHALEGHDGRVSSVSYSPDGRRIAVASQRGAILIWDTTSGSRIQTLDDT